MTTLDTAVPTERMSVLKLFAAAVWVTGTAAMISDGIAPSEGLPDLPHEVRAERDAMTRQLMVHVCAERERALANGAQVTHASWDGMATGLVDALTGLSSAGRRMST